MVDTDTTTVMLQMLKEMQKQRKFVETAEERNRRDMIITYEELRSGKMLAARCTPTDRVFAP